MSLKLYKAQLIDKLIDLYNKYMLLQKNSEAEIISALTEKIYKTESYTALYHHIFIADKKIFGLGELIAIDTIYEKILQEQYFLDDLHNPVLAARFESELAWLILHHGPVDSLELINKAICDYLRRHIMRVNQLCINMELVKYKFCKSSDFENIFPSNKLIELLSRPLDDPHNISECFTLHLIFFNFNNIYMPELDNISDISYIKAEKRRVHRLLRPDNKGEMFEEKTRGRESIFSIKRSKDFGICDLEALPDHAKNWHRFDFTPHKYRAKAIPSSPIVQTFREERIPFISGPSGTVADCLEGLHFLVPDMKNDKLEEYINLLAAAEIGQGHHALHEIILTAMNKKLFGNLQSNKTTKNLWELINYSRSYENFLSPSIKSTSAYTMLAVKYPQYLSPNRNFIDLKFHEYKKNQNDKLIFVQRYIRARESYQELNQGLYWHHPTSVLKNKLLYQQEFQSQSKKNILCLENQLFPLSSKENELFLVFMSQNFDLTHYTQYKDLLKIIESDKLLSNSILDERYANSHTSNSSFDIKRLSNGRFVFFRFELIHNDSKNSRFGDCQLIFPGRESSLLVNGWVSLFEMVEPETISNVVKLYYNKKNVRECVGRDKQTLSFNYNKSKSAEINLTETIFYGPDILNGIALSMIREMRRIGGEFQSEYLNSNLSPRLLNHLLSNLFRVEAKIPSSVTLTHSRYQILAPTLLNLAIINRDIIQIVELIENGIDIKNALFQACRLMNDQGEYMIEFLYQFGASLTDKNGNTPAHIAASENNMGCLIQCLKFIDIDLCNYQDMPILSMAVGSSNNLFSHIYRWSHPETIQKTFYKAAELSNADILNKLQSCGFDIYTNLVEGKNIFQLAFNSGKPEFLFEIFQSADEMIFQLKKLNLNRLNKSNNSLLHILMERKMDIIEKCKIANWLIANGINYKIKNKNHDTALHLMRKNEGFYLFNLYIEIIKIEKNVRLFFQPNFQRVTIIEKIVESGSSDMFLMNLVNNNNANKLNIPENELYALIARIIVKQHYSLSDVILAMFNEHPHLIKGTFFILKNNINTQNDLVHCLIKMPLTFWILLKEKIQEIVNDHYILVLIISRLPNAHAWNLLISILGESIPYIINGNSDSLVYLLQRIPNTCWLVLFSALGDRFADIIHDEITLTFILRNLLKDDRISLIKNLNQELLLRIIPDIKTLSEAISHIHPDKTSTLLKLTWLKLNLLQYINSLKLNQDPIAEDKKSKIMLGASLNCNMMFFCASLEQQISNFPNFHRICLINIKYADKQISYSPEWQEFKDNLLSIFLAMQPAKKTLPFFENSLKTAKILFFEKKEGQAVIPIHSQGGNEQGQKAVAEPLISYKNIKLI